MTPPRLPRVKPGDPVRAELFNELADAVRRCSVTVVGGSGLSVSKAGVNGVTIYDGGADDAVAFAVLSGALANATVAATPTSASATLYSFNGSSIVSTGVSVTVWNDHDKTFASGSQIKVTKIGGAWFVIDVRSCTNLS